MRGTTRAEPDVGIVVAVRPRLIHIRIGERMLTCDLRRGLLRGLRGQRTALAVGDRVILSEDAAGRSAIKEILPRHGKISRLGSARPRREHVIAAQVDQLLAMQATIQPAFNPRGLDRLLLLGEVGAVPGAVCINKIDLLGGDVAEQLGAPYAEIGYPVFLSAAIEGRGEEEISAFLQGKTTLLIGPSGAGKTTLLNRLIPGLDSRTAEVSAATGRGVHTTTRVDYLELPCGGVVIDSPGLRAIQPWTVPEALAGHFPEMRDRLGTCHFRDCLHRSEPGCGVRSAVSQGEITPAHYDSYLRILEGLLAEVSRESRAKRE